MSDGSGDNVELPIEGGALRAEYERELGTWLRRRLGYLCVAYAAYQILSTSALVIASIGGVSPGHRLNNDTPSTLEPRAEQAEIRGQAGLAPLPGNESDIALSTELSQRETTQQQRDRSAEAVVSTLDAFSSIANDLATEVKSGFFRRRPEVTPPRMAPADRWWLEESSSPLSAPLALDSATDTQAAAETHEPRTAGVIESPPSTSATSSSADFNQSGEAADPALLTVTDEAVDDEWSTRIAASPVAWWVFASFAPVMLGVVAWFGLVLRPRLFTRTELVAAASRMILILGIFNFAFEAALLLVVPNTPATPLLSIFFWHLTASLFLPWTWRESIKPIAPLLGIWLLLSLGLAVPQNDWLLLGFKIFAVPFLFAPALILCYTRLQWHRNRFKNGFIGRRFLEMRREFQQARAVHESLFPKPVTSDWMRFDFGYRPAADIGGDFIHTWIDDSDRFHLALIDVTGHGLTSAMSVARIHGEIERLRDEYPHEGPAKLLGRLNRYFHRLLARHRLYATGILLTVDPRRGELRYASAGHPPILLRSKGTITELASTTYLLGAVDDATFEEEEITVQLEERDTLILFTDGAYDAKSPHGERFGMTRLREIVGRPVAPPNWTQFLMRLIETFEAGMAEDDLLVAEFTFLHRRSVSSVTGDAPPTTRSVMNESDASKHTSAAGALLADDLALDGTSPNTEFVETSH